MIEQRAIFWPSAFIKQVQKDKGRGPKICSPLFNTWQYTNIVILLLLSLACFLLSLTIMNTFKIKYLSYSKLFKELKDGIEVFFSRPSSFQSSDQKQLNCCIDQLLKNCLTYLNFDVIFEFLGQFTLRCIYHFLKR